MKTISIDIETFSDIGLGKCGVYKYSESPSFEILLFGYSVDDGPVQVIDLSCGEQIPEDILDALTDDTVLKWAFNANFERVCLSRYLRDLGRSLDPFHDKHPLSTEPARFLNPQGWRCSMVWAATMGLPLSLKGVGAVLNLEDQKMDEGKALIRYFSVPCAPTKANGGRTRNRPSDDPAKWATFKRYNKRDVEVEMLIQKRLRNFPVPDFVWNEYHIDQKINDRGVRIDMDLVEKALDMDTRSRSELTEKMQKLTDLENPNSVQQMKRWLSDNGMEVNSLGKKAVAALLKTAPPELAEVLELRQQLAKSSVKKYQTMQRAVCSDSRARGMFMFYGANRTGRWAGRLIQLQNLPQNHLPDLDAARALVKSGEYEALKMIYEDVPDTLSQLIRTAFIPQDGCRFYVADFSAIEARVIAWYAGEQWKSDAFANGEDIYCSTASRMFHKPVVKHGVNGELRAKGKIAELACGYGGSTGALKAMGALEMGLSEDELPDIVSSWRDANQQIVRFWWDVDKAVMQAVKNHRTTRLGKLTFFWQSGMLFITLPSGRSLAYVKPKVGMNRFGSECITYEGVGGTKKWERLESYGPKFVENIVQATSRDILCNSMKTLRHCAICMHIHDELVIEADPRVSLDALCEQMGRAPSWADGLVLRADGYVCDFYKKN
ncbi:DNA polymerase [Muricomes intestini]|uniref:DNA-directed DNA polymerase n=1 Tax=Muricomes intestini TaxID=1796634 RepID=A0A4R3KCC7_9FIRM|nr:DNA polymerase [Muricomes intestini]TCS80291.1 DNA polymerase [Muricomes intestini]